ncbi:MAG: exodeoxyribonuclease V subunit alpha [Gemmatimonadaceae bacterium]
MSTRPGEPSETNAIDEALAELLVRRAGLLGETAGRARDAIRTLSGMRADGHSALPLTREPAGAEWRRALIVGGLAGDFDDLRPLVLTGDLLQFRRYAEAERRIAARVRARVGGRTPRLRLITGGPGSGKTTEIARQIVARVTADPEVRIALAAPTGKAAARLTASIGARLAENDASAEVRARIPADARTLHRLLGYRPTDDTFRQDGAQPLGEDLIIVDEASMIDVLMMDALLAALRDDAELVLVGDHHQLASVDAGDVLGALIRHPAAAPVVTKLTGNHRFTGQPGISGVAVAIRDGAIDRAVELLLRGEHPDARCLPTPTTQGELLAPIVVGLEACLAAESPRALLDALDGVRILCAERKGPFGVAGLNAIVEQWGARRGLDTRDPWYHRRPVLVGANDYGAEVFNGDLGVCWRERGRTEVHFPTPDGGTRRLPPERLPVVSTAWAMTVHKSQGSEFGEVLLVLPREESRLLNRELIYTGLTRARRQVTVMGTEAVLRAGLQVTASRTSGLEAQLDG